MGFIIGRKSPTNWKGGWRSFVEGCISGGFFTIVGAAFGRWMNWHWLAITAVALSPLIWPAAKFLWMRRSQVAMETLEQFAEFYSYGLLAAIILVAGIYHSLGAGPQTPAFVMGALLLVCFLGELLHVVLALIIMLLGGILLSTSSGEVECEDPCCPHCSYCLLGIDSMRCPECGNTFTFEQLGTTEAEFRARSIESAAKRTQT